MQDYRIVIPLGAQLPQVGQVLTTHEKDFADRPITIKVAAINGITWGTAPDKQDGDKHKVAAIFVDLYGAPYPEIVTPGTIFPKKKHFVIFDRRTAEPKACYDLGDAIREMSPNKCPVCERKKQDSDTFEAVGTSIRLLAETMAAYGISMEGCTTWEELLARILEKVPKKRTRKKRSELLCNSCLNDRICKEQDKATTQETGSCNYYYENVKGKGAANEAAAENS